MLSKVFFPPFALSDELHNDALTTVHWILHPELTHGQNVKSLKQCFSVLCSPAVVDFAKFSSFIFLLRRVMLMTKSTIEIWTQVERVEKAKSGSATRSNITMMAP